MPITFKIPRLSDREIISALWTISRAIRPDIPHKYSVVVYPRYAGEINTSEVPENDPNLDYLFEAGDHLIHTFRLRAAHNSNPVLEVKRDLDRPYDTVVCPELDEIFRSLDLASAMPRFSATLVGAARRELKASDLDASLTGSADTEWNRYRQSQMLVLSSLQQTSANILVESTKRNAALDLARSEQAERVESDLRAKFEEERRLLKDEYDRKSAALVEREQQAAKREAAFNTKEAGYVSRQLQIDQITKLNEWIEKGWKITPGTTGKRRPILFAYLAAIVATGALTGLMVWSNFEVMKAVDAVAKFSWWQWAMIGLKVFGPFAAFTTFLIYYIRWEGAWARQHSEEEFRTRSRLLDVGRSSWLLEAVRDANEKGKDIPVDLMKELSRNLFGNVTSGETDSHPSAMSDLLLHGLTSVRLKSPDGSEVEAKRDGRTRP